MSDDELKAMFGELRQDLREETAAIRQENAAMHSATRRQFAEAVESIATENRHFFGVAAEGLRHEIRLVAEAVAETRESLVRHAGELHEKIDRTASETQAMLKFSHAELDRRVTVLEKTQSQR